MRSLRAVIASLLVLVWVLATAHCNFETLPGFEFLKCESGEHTSDAGDSSDDTCKDRGCCSLEAAAYQVPQHQEIMPDLGAILLTPIEPLIVEKSLPREVSLGILTAAPPDLPVSWMFHHRTALPPRAPSVDS